MTIASVETIAKLVNDHLPGVPLQPLSVAPRQIPFHAGFAYFELDRNSPRFRELKSGGGIAHARSGQLSRARHGAVGDQRLKRRMADDNPDDPFAPPRGHHLRPRPGARPAHGRSEAQASRQPAPRAVAAAASSRPRSGSGASCADFSRRRQSDPAGGGPAAAARGRGCATRVSKRTSRRCASRRSRRYERSGSACASGGRPRGLARRALRVVHVR